MKLISFAVPCYNSAAYMSKCIESLLVGGEDIEIVIVDDGSTKDETARIADEYAAKYPTIIKAVHQENGGHGEAVNTGLLHATGKYFKVVDSDDWVDAKSFKRVISCLKGFAVCDEPDMLICNYVYDKVGAKRKKVIHYDNVFPVEQSFTWEDAGRFKLDQYILMHSVIYKTELLRGCALKLPKHTFYVDNIFVFEPLPYVKKMYYLNTNFYRYYIGRDDQSVNEAIMIKRIDQQLAVTRRMIDYYVDAYNASLMSGVCESYMVKYLRIMMEVSSIFLILGGSKEELLKKEQLWQYVKNKDKRLYKLLRVSILGCTVNLPGRVGRAISREGYRVMNKLIGFN